MDRTETLQKLLQIEEYLLVKEESSIVHNTKDVTHFSDEIAEIRATVSDDILKVFDSKGLAREVDGCCSGCYMTIAKGDLIRMEKSEDKIPVCPSCHSLLYLKSFDS